MSSHDQAELWDTKGWAPLEDLPSSRFLHCFVRRGRGQLGKEKAFPCQQPLARVAHQTWESTTVLPQPVPQLPCTWKHLEKEQLKKCLCIEHVRAAPRPPAPVNATSWFIRRRSCPVVRGALCLAGTAYDMWKCHMETPKPKNKLSARLEQANTMHSVFLSLGLPSF